MFRAGETMSEEKNRRTTLIRLVFELRLGIWAASRRHGFLSFHISLDLGPHTQHFRLVFFNALPLAHPERKQAYAQLRPANVVFRFRRSTARYKMAGGKSAAKKVRKFGEVKRMISPADQRLKVNAGKAEAKLKEKKEAETRHVYVNRLSTYLQRCLTLCSIQCTTAHLALPLAQRSAGTAIPRPGRHQLHQPVAREPH